MSENITAQQLRNLEYKRLKFKIYIDYTRWRDGLKGGTLIQSKPILAFFSDLLDEVLEGIVKYEGYAKKMEALNKELAEIKQELEVKDKDLAQITSSLNNLTSGKRIQNPSARF